MRPELILWDWNGTLLDDVELCVDALNRLLEKHAYPQRYDRDQYRAIFGFPIEEYYVRAGFDFSRHSFAMLAEEYMDDYIPASAACPAGRGRDRSAGCLPRGGAAAGDLIGQSGAHADPPGRGTPCDGLL